MTLQVTAWVKCGTEARVPICKLNFINFYLNDEDKYFSFPLKKGSELNLFYLFYYWLLLL